MRQETNEQQIVEAVLNGRSEGQEAMVCRYAERVFAMVVRQVPDVMDAQELHRILSSGPSATSAAMMPARLRSLPGSAALPTV